MNIFDENEMGNIGKGDFNDIYSKFTYYLLNRDKKSINKIQKDVDLIFNDYKQDTSGIEKSTDYLLGSLDAIKSILSFTSERIIPKEAIDTMSEIDSYCVMSMVILFQGITLEGIVSETKISDLKVTGIVKTFQKEGYIKTLFGTKKIYPTDYGRSVFDQCLVASHVTTDKSKMIFLQEMSELKGDFLIGHDILSYVKENKTNIKEVLFTCSDLSKNVFISDCTKELLKYPSDIDFKFYFYGQTKEEHFKVLIESLGQSLVGKSSVFFSDRDYLISDLVVFTLSTREKLAFEKIDTEHNYLLHKLKDEKINSILNVLKSS